MLNGTDAVRHRCEGGSEVQFLGEDLGHLVVEDHAEYVRTAPEAVEVPFFQNEGETINHKYSRVPNIATEIAYDTDFSSKLLKKSNPNQLLPKETDYVSVKKMKIINGSADKDEIRTNIGGLSASEIEHRLHITHPWFLSMTECMDYAPAKAVESTLYQGEIVFKVDFVEGRYPCPICGKLCAINGREVRTYFHTTTFDCKTAIVAKVPKLECPDDGYPQMIVPWARPRACAWHELDLGGESPLQALQWELLAESKGVHREMESERRKRQILGPTNRKCI